MPVFNSNTLQVYYKPFMAIVKRLHKLPFKIFITCSSYGSSFCRSLWFF